MAAPPVSSAMREAFAFRRAAPVPASDIGIGAGASPGRPPTRPAFHRYLLAGERCEQEWRRHPVHLVRVALLAAVMAGLAVWSVREWAPPPDVRAAVPVAVAAAGLWFGYRALAWRSARVVRTGRRLMSVRGVLIQRVATLPLAGLVDVRLAQSPLGRALDYGTLRLTAAGRHSGRRRLADLPGAAALYEGLVRDLVGPESTVDITFADREFERLYQEPPRLSTVATPRPDPAAVRQEMLYHFGVLGARLDALTVAVNRRLDTEADPGRGSSPVAEVTRLPATGRRPRPRPGPDTG